ncbi:hypothetical protein [Dyella caseinilytica]|uniref:Antitoxin Xre/MbcA/ParS-like toxin-binding domain-containing protein n=1 Tax=Dyella caseinilytica TaxID=1849581 RepID=A0ABX7GTX5_9GAMM|nr:hypothetical protein [Dyella caseinilytica]QRN53887.1 hypothetical protein ISN74_00245 [Dyella caseinilytica]GFZ89879.1 hypothetical protein GCM10011408_06200 [Dyella caseinilytica]
MSQGIIRRIFNLAAQLEPDRKLIWDWLFHTHIETLGGHTALELVFADQGEQVISLLEAALHDEASKKLLPQQPDLLARLH